jgi:hypothetical protein
VNGNGWMLDCDSIEVAEGLEEKRNSRSRKNESEIPRLHSKECHSNHMMTLMTVMEVLRIAVAISGQPYEDVPGSNYRNMRDQGITLK